MMSKRYNDPFIAAIDDNDIVWKTAKNKAFCSLVARDSRHRRKWKKPIFYNIKARFNRLKKLSAKAGRSCSYQTVAASASTAAWRRIRNWGTIHALFFRGYVSETQTAPPILFVRYRSH